MFTETLLRALARSMCCGILLLAPLPVWATTWTVSGTLSGTSPVSAAATFVTSGSTMTLTLVNTSPTANTIYPNQVLTSFYFDMLVNGTGRVGLQCTGGSGYVSKVVGGGTAAQPFVYVPPSTTGTGPSYTPNTSSPFVPQLSDILVAGTGDNSWMFKSGFDVTTRPFSYYGLGTVGNSSGSGTNSFAPNTFPSPYVDGIDFGIFAGAASDPRGNLINGPNAFPYLVSGTATFTFTADRDIGTYEFADPYVFGFGTAPDQYISIVPEPSGAVMLGGGSLLCWLIGRRRRAGRGARGATARFPGDHSLT